MKRFTWTLVIILLLAALMIVPTFANSEGGTAALSGAQGRPGETVKLTLSLSGFAYADTIGVNIQAEDGLMLDKTSSTWLLEGGMAGPIDSKNNTGWTVDGAAVDVNKQILELAVKLPTPDATQTDLDYRVKCVVTVISGQERWQTEAEATVSVLLPATDLGLEYTAAEVDLHKEKTLRLNWWVTPANTTDPVTWSSGDPAVATVKDGLVTALKPGTTEITVTAGGLSKRCIVTVYCSHDLTLVPAKEPTCQETGNYAYYICQVCAGVLKANGITPTTVEAETLPLVGHSYENGFCIHCKERDPDFVFLTITQQPTSAFAAKGEQIATTVVAEGEGLTYQWYMKEAKGTKFVKSSITTDTYTYKMTAAKSDRQVYCVITDKYGNSVQSDTVVLTMFYISKQPKGDAASNGELASTSVKAVGTGVQYQWYVKDLGNAEFIKSSVKGAIYSYTMKAGKAGRQLYCVITDKYGNSLQTDTVVFSMINITQQPVDTQVPAGETISVTVQAEGEGLQYQWYMKHPNGTSFGISTITGDTYSYKMVASKDGRQVYCIITDKYGNRMRTETATLSMIKSVITITQQPGNSVVAEGETVSTTVVAEGEGLKYQWYVKNPGSSVFTKSSITTSTYSYTMTAGKSGRQVYCVITDKYGVTVQTETVVLSMITITRQPVDTEVAPGEMLFVTVKAEGKGLKYQWYVKNPGSETFIKSSITTNVYSYTMNAAKDGRQVYCVITDKYGNSVTTDTVTLTMKKSVVTIIDQELCLTAPKGQTVSVTIEAQGDGLTYKWYFKNPGGKAFALSSITGKTYSYTMTAGKDGRQVYCVITDKYGNSVTTEIFTLTMSEAIVITQQPVDTAVREGETIDVTVEAEGEGLKYQWYVKNPGGKTFSKSSITGKTYSYTMTAGKDGRQVYCLITDKYGNTMKTEVVTLTMLGPIVITQQPVDATALNGETVSTTVEAEGEGLKYQWYVKNPGGKTFSKSSITGKTYSYTMTAGKDGRQVYCVITDKHGNTIKTDVVTLTMVVKPVSGSIVKDYAMDHLAYYPTTKDWRTHDGVDFQAEEGQAVVVTAAGTVTKIYMDELWGYTVVITHDNGFVTTYGSLLENAAVRVGDQVKRGQTIGYAGNTAPIETASGAHVHFGVSYKGVSIDPKAYFAEG